eukprot:s3733_g3.t2
MSSSSDSSDSSESEEEKKKKDKKKAKKKDKDKKKKGDKKKKDKKKSKKDKKKKKKSSSDSSSSDNKKAKKERKRKQEEDNAKNAWLATKMRELRKADANLTARDAMKMAEAEYEKIFNGGGGGGEVFSLRLGCRCCPNPKAASVAHSAEAGAWGLPAAAEAAKEAEEEARKQGKSEEEIAKAAREAGERVIKVAEEAGVYKAPKELPLFMQNRLKQQSEAARLAAMPAPVAGENSRPTEMQEPRRLALKLPPDTKDKKRKR